MFNKIITVKDHEFTPLFNEYPIGLNAKQIFPSRAKRSKLLAARYVSGRPALAVIKPRLIAQP